MRMLLPFILVLMCASCASPNVQTGKAAQSPKPKAQGGAVDLDPRHAKAQAPTEVYQAALMAQPSVVGEPAVFTLHAWFMEGTNFPASDAWTNDWQFLGALMATNLLAPSNEWTFVPLPMEIYKGHLGFTYQGTDAAVFLRAKFQSKGDS